MFSKRDNFRGFVFAYLEDEYPKMGSTFKGMNVLRWEHFFSFEITPIYKGGNNENAKVASPESVPIHLKELLTAKILLFYCPTGSLQVGSILSRICLLSITHYEIS